ncbi:hypothetical protein F2Q69_00063398 [Brassica cretica]|uniref:Fucosyltransferase n=1 Tax=Brassica cretica TaxID=69181 RepID=A0A8S9RQI6_BRACR|nr:hypothetical protein F2Q69_00063398 [Brassica cretica]
MKRAMPFIISGMMKLTIGIATCLLLLFCLVLLQQSSNIFNHHKSVFTAELDEDSCLSRYQSCINSTTIPSQLYLYLFHDYGDHDQMFFCEDKQMIIGKVPWLVAKSNQYFVPSLWLIPSFLTKLIKLFPQKDTVFHHLSRRETWDPSKSLRSNKSSSHQACDGSDCSLYSKRETVTRRESQEYVLGTSDFNRRRSCSSPAKSRSASAE